jgi:hypothetical protein
MQSSYEKTIQWLLESDRKQPGVRYFALRDLMNLPDDDFELRSAKEANMANGPVQAILAAQNPDGYWVKPGTGYSPKYTGTIWQLIFLSQFGADGTDKRIRKACEYALSHSMASNGVFSMTGAPSGFVHCLSGNLIASLIDFGMVKDDRVLQTIEFHALLILGPNIKQFSDKNTKLRYYKSGTSGPEFACGNNLHFPCAWGAIKTLLAFGKIPMPLRSETVKRAIDKGVALLLSCNPALADYPSVYGKTPSKSWFKFGYPLGYMADVLQNLEALVSVGHIHDLRVNKALEMIISKQDSQRRWHQEYSYNSKMWAEIETPGLPSKWITLRALRVLKAAQKI